MSNLQKKHPSDHSHLSVFLSFLYTSVTSCNSFSAFISLLLSLLLSYSAFPHLISILILIQRSFVGMTKTLGKIA